jgi:hypothetical protein
MGGRKGRAHRRAVIEEIGRGNEEAGGVGVKKSSVNYD